MKDQIEELEDRRTTLNYEKDELLKEQLELFEKLDVLEVKIHDEERRLDDMFYERRNELNAQEDRLKKEEENLSSKKKQLDYEEQSTKELLKKLWGIWTFWIIVAIVSVFISIFFVHGYLASDNRALNTYNKALSSYNTSIEKLNDQIMDKQTRLASKEDIWATYDCDNNDYGESMCPGTKIESLKSQIDALEQQKKELVKPQEPTL